MNEEGKLTPEQMEAAFWLLAMDEAFLSFGKSGFFFRPKDVEVRLGGFLLSDYSVGLNMNDTFYSACADAETVPWEEIVDLTGRARRFEDEKDRSWFLVDWVAKRRGHDPEVKRVREGLAEFRRRHPEFERTPAGKEKGEG